jgi:hypothetical protein
VWVTTGLEDGAEDETGAEAELAVTAEGAAATAGAPAADVEFGVGPSAPALKPDCFFGFACRVTWVVRWMTTVRTFGFGGAEAELLPAPELELIAAPAKPPRPITVAPAAIFVFALFTSGPPEVG